MRNRAVRKILDEKPLVLVTSPVCADWISETDASCVKRGIEEKRRRVDKSAMHLNFVCNLHMLQHHGRYFIHEQPRSATSWEASCVREVQCKTGAFTTNVDHCMYGLTRKIGIEDLPARRATTLMSNMPAVRAILKDRCDGQHRHAALNNGHPTDQLDEHSGVLGAVIVRAIKLQKQWDTMGMQQLSVTEPQKLAAGAQEDLEVPEEEETPELFDATAEIAWDDVSGKYLDADTVKQARASEMDYYRKMSVYRKVPISECIADWGTLGGCRQG